jgi:hypothetical protein
MKGKLIMSWDIAPQHDQDYFEFVVREFMPGIQKIGFELEDAWVTVYGKHPQILVGVMLPSINEIRTTVESEQWKELHGKLLGYVVNYSQKVVLATSSFQF